MSNIKSQFTQQYAISKTLRFELKPVGNTEEHIQHDGIIEQDTKKAERYKKVKVIIDDFHRDFIEQSLRGFQADWSELSKQIQAVKTADKKKKKYPKEELKKTQTTYRKKITAYIKQNTPEKYKFADITNASLIKTILSDWLKEKNREDEIYLLDEFKGFDGYFTGLHTARKNIYSDKDQTTALAYRVVHDNFPKFLSNINIVEKNLEKHSMFDDIQNGAFAPNIEISLQKSQRTEIQKSNLKNIAQKIQMIFEKGIDYFNTSITQNGIEEYNDYIKVYNSLNNLYKQHKGLKNKEMPNVTELFKQILAKSTKGAFIEKLENDGETISVIDEFRQHLQNEQTLEKLQTLLENIDTYDTSKMYWQHDQLHTLSHKVFDNWHFIKNALTHHYEKENGIIINETKEKKRDTWLKQNSSLDFLQQCIDDYIKNIEPENTGGNANIIQYLKTKKTLLIIEDDKYKNIREKYAESKEKALTKPNAEPDVEIIKKLLDAYHEVLWLFKPFILKKDEQEKNDAFYSELEMLYHQLSDISHLYDIVRNYITQKPYAIDKIKLNFENPTLADGWDINKENANTSIILEKEGLYYLAIMHKNHKKIFEQSPKNPTGECYKKLNYKLLSGANKMLPKVFLSEKGKKNFKPSQHILDLYENAEHKKGDTFNIDSCHKLIDFFKEHINTYKVKQDDEYGWEVFGFDFSPTQDYEDISQFYKEVEQQGYKIWFSDISKDYIDECVKNGELYLFQLYNKDFSPYSKGKKNLHTLYWLNLFSPENFEDTIYKLNGEAELFFRPKSIKKHITHPKNQKIKNKKDNSKSLFTYDLIKDKRFTENKYFFHVPITINFQEKEIFNFNKKVIEFLKDNADIKIIGIDRGEKNLVYYSVIDQNGTILEQASLNSINETNYHTLLDETEKARDKARKDWKTINKIKDLKAGYISAVVHKISKLMIEHNAIVVMEDLNMGMKRGRQKIEKQVYQNLEKALIQKLNYLAFKEYKTDEVGSIRHGLQLSAPFESFEKMRKQTGFIFYVNAPYTSKIDFLTGFVPFKYFKHENLKTSQAFMSGIKTITHHHNDFVIEIDYSKIPQSKTAPKTKWTLHLDNQKRYEWNNKNRKNQAVNVYEKLKECFDEQDISLTGNIAEHIAEANKPEVYQILFKYINIVSQMRFTAETDAAETDTAKKGEDYILSPIAPHFRTDVESETIPKDSDANGAYHIALKGLYMLHHKINKEITSLFISNEEWFAYVQERASKK